MVKSYMNNGHELNDIGKTFVLGVPYPRGAENVIRSN